jgi:peptidoglycan/xylan/chitin deacetylase (PgdA/CDA1 family)
MIADLSVGPFILMYHSVSDGTDDPFSVSVDSFWEQLSWLSANGYEVVTLSYLLRSIQAENYIRLNKKVVITFDDGYQDFVANALPILLDFSATATVFLVTSLFGETSSWNEFDREARLMTEDEARYIKSQGISLGSHTATHEKLTLLGQNELQHQLNISRDTLMCLGESFCSFSYPWGQWSNLVVDAVKATGYECAVGVGEQTQLTAANRYSLPRIIMRRDMDLKKFQSILTRTRVEMELRRGYRNLRETKFGSLINNLFDNGTNRIIKDNKS